MKKILLFTALVLIVTAILSANVFAVNVGDKLGDVLYSDIKTYINDIRIPCYTIDGKVVVILDDLKNYSFDTRWDGNKRTTTVTLNNKKKIEPIRIEYNARQAGSVAFPYVYTNIQVLINGKKVDRYSINGQLCIKMEELSVFGDYIWDSQYRTVSLTTLDYEKAFNLSTLPDGNKKPAVEYAKQDKLYTHKTTSLYNYNRTLPGLTKMFIPSPYTSTTPSDVGGIIIFTEEREWLGNDTNGAQAYNVYWNIKIIDPYKNKIIDEKDFIKKGTPPHSTVNDVLFLPSENEATEWVESVWRNHLSSLDIKSDFDYLLNKDGSLTIVNYKGKDKNVVIPASVNGKNITAIGGGTFYQRKITDITIPNGITSIGDGAFYQCTVPSIKLPDSVNSIEDSAFYQCSITSITIPDNVTSISDKTFALSKLTSITIPDSVTSIGAFAFWNCMDLKSVTIPSSVTFISDSAFASCFNLTVTCSRDSYAHKYCVNNKIKFELK